MLKRHYLEQEPDGSVNNKQQKQDINLEVSNILENGWTQALHLDG